MTLNGISNFGRPVKTTERRHILKIILGESPQTPLSGDVPQVIHPSLLPGLGLLCPADGGLHRAPPTLPRSPPTLKVADNPGPRQALRAKYIEINGHLSNTNTFPTVGT